MDKQLQLFSATLESWLLVQRGWLKLEAVFAAPDIQRQVPGEAAAFAQVDKTFKDIMRRTHDRPNALQVCAQQSWAYDWHHPFCSWFEVFARHWYALNMVA